MVICLLHRPSSGKAHLDHPLTVICEPSNDGVDLHTKQTPRTPQTKNGVNSCTPRQWAIAWLCTLNAARIHDEGEAALWTVISRQRETVDSVGERREYKAFCLHRLRR